MIVGAPVAWLLLAPFYFMKIFPFAMTRYVLTNRRVVIQRGWHLKTAGEVPLAEIEKIEIEEDDNSEFYREATLKIHDAENKLRLTLPGVPEPESFRHSIVNAVRAWAPGKLQGPFVPAKAT